MNYMIISTMRKGVVRESCTDAENERINAGECAIQRERDLELTIEELWLMQGKACGFYQNGKRRKVTA